MSGNAHESQAGILEKSYRRLIGSQLINFKGVGIKSATGCDRFQFFFYPGINIKWKLEIRNLKFGFSPSGAFPNF